MATQLGAANASRSNGSNLGFGTLSGSIPTNDNRNKQEIKSAHELIKMSQQAAMRGDWDTYQTLQAQIKFS